MKFYEQNEDHVKVISKTKTKNYVSKIFFGHHDKSLKTGKRPGKSGTNDNPKLLLFLNKQI